MAKRTLRSITLASQTKFSQQLFRMVKRRRTCLDHHHRHLFNGENVSEADQSVNAREEIYRRRHLDHLLARSISKVR